MKLYGYSDEGLPIEQVVPVELAEITLCATPSELRRMAVFLNASADEMDRVGETFDHTHLSDEAKEFEHSPHFVVARLDA